MRSEPSFPARTVVRESPLVWGAVLVGFPALGAALGWGLVAIAEWVTGLPWAPLRGLFGVIDEYAGTPLAVALAVAGAGVGLSWALIGAAERLVVEVDPGGARLQRGKVAQSVPRAEVGAVFVDGKELVLQRRDGSELARERSDLSRSDLASAFAAHGYPWRDGGDPYEADFRPWFDGAPGLPAGADAVLRARAEALQRDDKPYAADLRTELGRLGVVVRDQGRRQYWRLTAG